MIKKAGILLIILLLAGCTGLRLAMVPSDIKRYCSSISGTSKGTGQNMNTCIQNELAAKRELSGMHVPSETEKYCRRLSASTGGSYQVILTCIQTELPDR